MGTCLDRGRIPVGDTQEICSTLVRPGAGLTTELFHSSRSETFDSSSDAGGGNVLQYDETLGEMDPYLAFPTES